LIFLDFFLHGYDKADLVSIFSGNHIRIGSNAVLANTDLLQEVEFSLRKRHGDPNQTASNQPVIAPEILGRTPTPVVMQRLAAGAAWYRLNIL